MPEIEMIARVQGPATVCGAPEGLDALVFADTARLRRGVNVFIARDDSRAAAFVAELGFFAPGLEILRLPAWDCQPYDRISPSPRVAARRAATLARLPDRHHRQCDGPALSAQGRAGPGRDHRAARQSGGCRDPQTALYHQWLCPRRHGHGARRLCGPRRRHRCLSARRTGTGAAGLLWRYAGINPLV